MSRVPDCDGDGSPEGLAAAAVVRARRPGGHLLNLDRMLLHSAPLAEGWMAFMPRLRNDLALPSVHRELLICAVARVTGAEYEFHHHAPLFRRAGGSAEQLDRLGDVGAAATDEALFDPEQRALLRLAQESTTGLRLSEATHAALSVAFGPRLIVEAVAVVAAYNMVARILLALEVEVEARR